MEDALKPILRADDEIAWWDVSSHFNIWFDGGIYKQLSMKQNFESRLSINTKRIEIMRWKTYKHKKSP